MTHIELSLSPLEPIAADPLHSWSAPVTTAEESCLVIDAGGIIIAASTAWTRLLVLEPPSELTGSHVLDVLCLIDFTAAGNELGEAEREQIPRCSRSPPSGPPAACSACAAPRAPAAARWTPWPPRCGRAVRSWAR
ncbi:hypothetical protein ACFQY4_45330 [Catellatospora bangladeshensis]|uniref:hypothetical protein n=1 Tax=Catellatospora bangladeshensis TaxID=310355 RepID=UPI00360A3EAC